MEQSTYSFGGENPNERVQFILRRHPWTLLHVGIWLVVLLLILTTVLFVFKGSWVTSWVVFLVLPIALLIAGRAWFCWWNSTYLLTNERIIVVDQQGWFQRKVTELNLANIITINHDTGGLWATMLNFGNVNIQCSGAAEQDVALRAVFDPYEVQQQIVRAQRARQGT